MPYPLNGAPRDHGGSRGECCVDHSEHGLPAGRESRPPIEPHPSEPDQRGPQRHKCPVVGHLQPLSLILIDIPPGPHNKERSQGGAPGRNVHDDAASKVLYAPKTQKAVGAPDPVRQRTVNAHEPSRDKHKIGWEADALREGARDDGGGEDCNHHLVRSKGNARNPTNRLLHGVACRRAWVQIVEKGIRGRRTDEPSPRFAKGQGEANSCPQYGDEPYAHETLHHDRKNRVPVHQSAVEECYSRRHEQHQHRTQHHERRIRPVNCVTVCRRPSGHARGLCHPY
mmetsp:Transcript_20854/g.48194  ORF Transcript_20854/g.48194 Transcript_20854/m.48194 type:complete len:283 (-) Transcript_20854:220-1068(-)